MEHACLVKRRRHIVIYHLNGVQAEKGLPKEGDNHTLGAKAIGQKPAALEDSKKAVEQLKKVENPDKKPGCRPGSMMTMGVGC